ncbi:lipopolysaccharide biosynthesis protein [Aquisalimonas asiatica]|uniref:Membrane protein involved in the export of O-antigen and teichoic acid n=1 Tax=Aquisalimonas asiatica TaxID=406100 RepID=A0A1H8U457_9GAMM|nr:lipopolysaccharide biosynthesis protein [Aquisalimonas asiatica]SEO97951.1 Membrane protein involved in the export of O-antigen and teichoic acid [Aquisalimonas asiatica]
MTSGAFWMVLVRFLERNVGLISTLILARLLVPEDFGLVAMAMVFFQFLKLFAQFGLQNALIRFQDADRSYYDTAWTLILLMKSGVALALVLSAPFIAAFFDEPRVQPIIYVLAGMALIEGTKNVAIVDLMKKFQFRRYFAYSLSKKVAAFTVTVSVALIYQNYWALVAGNVAGAVAGFILSYTMVAYRPWFSLERTGKIFRFSSWLFVNNVAQFIRDRGTDLIIGRMAGAAPMGTYRVAFEISNLPTSEIYAPLMRAFFPGFASIAHDRERLRRVYLDSQAVIATLTVPAGIGIVILAEPVVWTLLGANWLVAIPLIQVLGLYGVGQVLHGNRAGLFMALGQPHWISLITAIDAAVTLPLMAWLLAAGYGIEVAVWAKIVGSLVAAPLGIALVLSRLGISLWTFAAIFVRPALATAAMAALLLWAFGAHRSADGAVDALTSLAVAVPAGAVAYGLTVLALWLLSGRPAGAETRILGMVGPAARKLLAGGTSRASKVAERD